MLILRNAVAFHWRRNKQEIYGLHVSPKLLYTNTGLIGFCAVSPPCGILIKDQNNERSDEKQT